tara:strand:+ start:149 stop:862 length:714 start_codon:yes stop_codon:yes gene_type:complete
MNKIDINIADIQEKMSLKLIDAGWGSVFSSMINSEGFHKLLYKLKTEAENDRRFTPKLKDLFRAFEECPYDKLKVIFISQDPYPQLGVADGISFSCSNNDKPQPSLRYIFSELEKQFPAFRTNDLLYDPLDLKRWSNQGVLMLNTAFTVQIGKIGSHYDLWKPFTHHILQHINREFKDLQVVLLGKKAEEWQLRLDKQTIHKVSHPASAAYKGGKWNSEDVFKKINNSLEYQDKIIW